MEIFFIRPFLSCRFMLSPPQLGRDVWEGEEKRGTSIPFPGKKSEKKKERKRGEMLSLMRRGEERNGNSTAEKEKGK